MADEAAELLAGLGLSVGGGGGDAAAKKKKKKAAAAKKNANAATAAANDDDAADEEESSAQAVSAETPVAAPTEGEGGEATEAKESSSKGKKKKPAAAPAAAAAPVKEKKAEPKHIVAAREAQARAQREREERARLEEEARRQEEEEKRMEEEMKKKEEEEKELKKKKKEEKKARLLAEGKPVTKAEKEKARKLAEARAQFLASGYVRGVTGGAEKGGADGEAGGDEKKKGKDKKMDKKKKEEPVVVKQEEEEEPVKVEPVAVVQAPPPKKAEKDWDEDSDDDDAVKQLQSKAREANEVVVIKEVVAAKTAPSASTKSTTAPKPAAPAKREKPVIVAKSSKQSAKTKPAALSKQQRKDSTTTSEDSDSGSSDSSDSDDGSDSSDDDDDGNNEAEQLRERILRAREVRLGKIKLGREEARKAAQLRSPICCVLGHVDTGKTKILDMLRKTNVQEGEAGGITQQIGATFFPAENMKMVAERLPKSQREEFKIPGLLVIDTPGHEAFSNLRSRGSGLADVAILVIDIMHGLEQQTIESIDLLKKRNTKFVVALNKIDRLFQWKSTPGQPVRECLEKQPQSTISEFETRTKQVVTALMEQGLNAKLYWENDSPEDTVSLCPTSAITGEGSPDLINQIVHVAQTEMFNRLCYSTELECTVLEVKKIEGLGTTIDVCLVNGELHDDDTLVLASSNGPIVTQVRSLLTPQPMKEMRVKGEYILHKTIKGAMGIKVTCQAELENVVAGTSVFQLTGEDDVEELKDAVMKDVADNLKDIATVPRGVFVQASTLGSLEGLMAHLKKENIPVSGVSVGPVRKKDVTRASSMLDTKQGGDVDMFEKEYASILAFNVKVDPAAQDLADELGIKIFTAEIVYHLADRYNAYAKELRSERKKIAQAKAVFPCIVKIIPGNIFRNKDPIVVGVDVIRGCVVEGTPLVIPDKFVDDPQNPGSKMMLEIGRVAGIEKDKVKVEKAVRGERVCIKIQGPGDSTIQVGRHFDETNAMYSKISRKSIDVLKAFFKEDIDGLKEEGWPFIQNELKKVFKVQ